MFFFFLCGEHTFRSEVEGYEGIMTQCHHCGNMSARVLKSRPFFTLCFVVSAYFLDPTSMYKVTHRVSNLAARGSGFASALRPLPMPSPKHYNPIYNRKLDANAILPPLAHHPLYHLRLQGRGLPHLQLPPAA